MGIEFANHKFTNQSSLDPQMLLGHPITINPSSCHGHIKVLPKILFAPKQEEAGSIPALE
jgi:hypothetical protein